MLDELVHVGGVESGALEFVVGSIFELLLDSLRLF